MRMTVVAGAMIGLVGIPSARAEEVEESREVFWARANLGKALESGWGYDGTQHYATSGAIDHDGVAGCVKALAELTKLGVPGTAMFETTRNLPGLTRGNNTIDAGRKSCEKLEKLGHIGKWEWRAHQAVSAFEQAGELHSEIEFFEMCIDAYDILMKAGVKPTDEVMRAELTSKVNGKPVVWEGTVESLRKKWCDTGLANAKEFERKKDAPYVAVLKDDKLELGLQFRVVRLAGGGLTEDPKVMAKASVWFINMTPPNTCTNGAEQRIVRRLQFKGHKLVKTTENSMCRSPSSKDYK